MIVCQIRGPGNGFTGPPYSAASCSYIPIIARTVVDAPLEFKSAEGLGSLLDGMIHTSTSKFRGAPISIARCQWGENIFAPCLFRSSLRSDNSVPRRVASLVAKSSFAYFLVRFRNLMDFFFSELLFDDPVPQRVDFC
jgi:hypothetical protein